MLQLKFIYDQKASDWLVGLMHAFVFRLNELIGSENTFSKYGIGWVGRTVFAMKWNESAMILSAFETDLDPA